MSGREKEGKVWKDSIFLPFSFQISITEFYYLQSVHLETLKTLLDRDVKEIGLDIGAKEIFSHLMQNERTDISSRAAACMAHLAEHVKGKFLSIELNLLPSLMEKLYHKVNISSGNSTH